MTSEAHFGFKYQPGTFIYRLDEGTTVFAPKYPLESKVFVHTHSPPHLATVVGLPTIRWVLVWYYPKIRRSWRR